MSSMFKVGSNDFIRGAVTAVFAAAITVLYGVTAQSDFSVFDANWGDILNQVIQVSVTAFIAYLSKNLLTDSEGKIGGVL